MPKTQERVLLFRHFPFSFNTGLPFDLGREVRLDKVDDIQQAVREVDRLDDRPRLKAILLQEQLAGVGQVHVCMRTPINTTAPEATTRLWTAIAAVRLIAPVEIQGSSISTFTLSGGTISEPGVLLNHPIISPTFRHRRLNADELGLARKVNQRLGNLKSKKLVRIRSAFTIWAQISGGACTSWQLAILGMTAVLEALFPQPRSKKYDTLTYGERLAKRVARFLKGRGFNTRNKERLHRIYDKYRNSIAHGVHDPNPTGTLFSRERDLLFIHDTARLVLLGMLSKTNAELSLLLPELAGSDAVQIGIDSLGSAKGSLIADAKLPVSSRKHSSIIEF